MMNNASIVGRLTKPVQVRKFSNGTPYTHFTVACDRQFKNKQGNYDADFIHCFVTGQSAQYLASKADKGNLVGLSGPIQTSRSQDQNGQTHFYWSVRSNHAEVVKTQPNSNTSSPYSNNANPMSQSGGQSHLHRPQPTTQDPFANSNGSRSSGNKTGDKKIDISDDDLPF